MNIFRVEPGSCAWSKFLLKTWNSSPSATTSRHVGYVHDITTELIERHPEVLRQLCRWAGARVPGADELLESRRNELRLSIGPRDSRLFKPDLYMLEWGDPVVVRVGADSPTAVVVVETQASANDRKPLTWDIYHLIVLLFHDVDPETLLVALGASMEDSCRKLRERVRIADIRLVGPSKLPRSLPEDVHLAAMMVAILKDQAPRELAEHALRGMVADLSDPFSADYYWMVALSLPTELREELQMNIKHPSDFTAEERQSEIYKRVFREGNAEGLERGIERGQRQALVQAVITVLRNRGLESTGALIIALGECRDDARLLAAVGRAAVIESVEQLTDELTTP